jgi:hypothetical protein
MPAFRLAEGAYDMPPGEIDPLVRIKCTQSSNGVQQVVYGSGIFLDEGTDWFLTAAHVVAADAPAFPLEIQLIVQTRSDGAEWPLWAASVAYPDFGSDDIAVVHLSKPRPPIRPRTAIAPAPGDAFDAVLRGYDLDGTRRMFPIKAVQGRHYIRFLSGQGLEAMSGGPLVQVPSVYGMYLGRVAVGNDQFFAALPPDPDLVRDCIARAEAECKQS